MTFRTALANFSKGVLSARLLRRQDVEAYNAALLRGDNIFVLKYGGFTIRPGWRYVDETLDDGELLFPFQFSDEQTYALAMGQGYMQPLAYGGFILEDEQAILGATNANPVVLNVPLHGLEVGDRLLVKAGSVSGMTELNARVWEVSGVPDDDHIAIAADGTGWGVFSGSTGGTTHVTPPPPPPPPPPVPPPPDPPPPPEVGGGGGDNGGGPCVADDTLIRMANRARTGPGRAKPARDVRVGDWVWTIHETTREWGAFEVIGSEFVDEPVFASGRWPRATARHRFDLGGWVCAETIGQPDGVARVWRGTVRDAHTYGSRLPKRGAKWVTSHNIKNYDGTFY